ncbi:MAG: hypothetical protein ABFC34_02265 [Methanobacterium sp.]
MDRNKKIYKKPELGVHGDLTDITKGTIDDIPDTEGGIAGHS